MSGDAPHYVIDPMVAFPKRWKDHIGPIRILAGPAGGWVLVRRPRGTPFALHVRHLLNTDRHPVHGPFTVIQTARRQ